MNLVLFTAAEIAVPLPRTDRRAVHLLDVLRRKVGERFDAGLIDGPRGKGTLVAVDERTLTLTFTWEATAAPPEPITLLVGLPRPQTARDILRDATTLGVAALHFVATEKGERSYAQSTLWSSDEWRRHLVTGAEQAFDPRLPRVAHGQTLAATIAALPATSTRLALDNYEAARALGESEFTRDQPTILAIGGERGWSATERDLLRAAGFSLVHLGSRVLRTETAVVAALAIVRAKLGLL